MRSCKTWAILLLVVSNLATLGFLFRAERELWLWGQTGAGWPRQAGAAAAQRDWDDGKERLLEISSVDSMPDDLINDHGIRIDYVADKSDSGMIYAKSFELFVEAYNDQMNTLISGRSEVVQHPFLELQHIQSRQLDRQDARIVPAGKVWAIHGHDVAKGDVTTSDVLIAGRAKIAELELEGDFWITFQSQQKQVIWVYESTAIGLGDTRGELIIDEFDVLEDGDD